jgi:hypothetical protein
VAGEDDAKRRALPPARGALAVYATVGAEGSAVAAVARTKSANEDLCIGFSSARPGDIGIENENRIPQIRNLTWR